MHFMSLLLTDFWTYIINQWGSSLWAEEPCCNICRWLCSLWHHVPSSGHSSKPMSHISSLHSHQHPQCPHFSCCPGCSVLPHHFSLCHSIIPRPGFYLVHPPPGQDLTWFIHWVSFGSFCLENATPFFFSFEYFSIKSTNTHGLFTWPTLYLNMLRILWDHYFIVQMLSCIYIKWCQENLKSIIHV